MLSFLRRDVGGGGRSVVCVCVCVGGGGDALHTYGPRSLHSSPPRHTHTAGRSTFHSLQIIYSLVLSGKTYNTKFSSDVLANLNKCAEGDYRFWQ